MIQKAMLLLCITISVISGKAQSISSSVIGSAADYSKSNAINLEWTLGEAFTETSPTAFGQLTQGFHQPILIVTTSFADLITAPTGNNSNIKIFPNPVRSMLQVSVANTADKKLRVSLSDISGKLLHSSAVYNRQETISIEMKSYPAGTYLLSITDSYGAVLKTFKVVKVL